MLIMLLRAYVSWKVITICIFNGMRELNRENDRNKTKPDDLLYYIIDFTEPGK